MSELRIALVAEGPLDRIIIEAALRATIAGPFILTLLQPEPTHPRPVNGWCGVFKWCREFAARSHASLETDPTLPGFDIFVIHIDADVADLSYQDGGQAVVQASLGLPALPCSLPCPPPEGSADELRRRLNAWLGLASVGPRTVLCVPSKAIDAWLAAGVLDDTHGLLRAVECSPAVDARLAMLPRKQRIKKSQLEYQQRASTVTRNWSRVVQTCTQAARFQRELDIAIRSERPP